MQKNRPVKTTQTSLELLEVIKELDGATVGELVDETGLARSTLHNHLQTLLETGYLIKEFNTYHLGLKLFQLGEYARTRKREYELAEEAVERLAVRTDMEADFNIEEYGRLINLHDMIANSSESGLDIGNYFYMHNTAAGKAMLAAYSRDRQEEIIETRGFPRETEHTITDEEELLAELETVQEQVRGQRRGVYPWLQDLRKGDPLPERTCLRGDGSWGSDVSHGHRPRDVDSLRTVRSRG